MSPDFPDSMAFDTPFVHEESCPLCRVFGKRVLRMGPHGYKGKHEEQKDDSSSDMGLSHMASLRNEDLLDNQTRQIGL